jgi:hypothetical protein
VTADRLLLILTRIDAAVVLCAYPCALLPFAWMDFVHREWLGLGPLPDAAITRYLSRSLSLVYATHAVLMMAITFDWERYRPLIRVAATAHIILGVGLFLTDLDAGMPWYWTVFEGPGVAALGLFQLFLYRRASRGDAGVR